MPNAPIKQVIKQFNEGMKEVNSADDLSDLIDEIVQSHDFHVYTNHLIYTEFRKVSKKFKRNSFVQDKIREYYNEIFR